MSSMNIDSPTCMNQLLPMARRFNKIQKKKSNCSSSSSLSLSSTSTCNAGSNKIKMALLNQIKNQHSLNDLNINFDNAYDYIEESGDLLPCIEEQEYSHVQEVYSTTSCMEEEDSVCELKNRNCNDMDNMMINSNNSMIMSGSTASHLSHNQDQNLGQNSMMMTSSTCMTAVKATRKLRLLTSFTRTNFFMDEEIDDYFVQLENKINDWLDEQGIQQVEPNSKKMSSSSNISINNPFSTSSIIQRRKLRNLGLY